LFQKIGGGLFPCGAAAFCGLLRWLGELFSCCCFGLGAVLGVFYFPAVCCPLFLFVAELGDGVWCVLSLAPSLFSLYCSFSHLGTSCALFVFHQ
jgi:1,4-dihydroxy-2-naphthoate octaprenyltransferase